MLDKLPPKLVKSSSGVGFFGGRTDDASNLRVDQIESFMGHVMHGRQVEAIQMLKTHPGLARAPWPCKDPGGRVFLEIMPLQYALWALDEHMWAMLSVYLTPSEALAQAQAQAGITEQSGHGAFMTAKGC